MLHPIRIVLAARLKEGKPGDILTDVELSGIAGFAVAPDTKGGRHLLGAMRDAEAEGVVWQRVKNERQIVCQSGREILHRTLNDVKLIGRRSRRSSLRISSVNVDSLSAAEKPAAYGVSAAIGAIALIAKPETARRMIKGAQGGPLQIGDAMKIFDR